MENRQDNRFPDEQLDMQIDQWLSGKREPNAPASNVEQVARAFARLASEESPRLSPAARARGINLLRARAAQKRAERHPNPFAFLLAAPRWAQIGAVALLVVLIANGVSSVAADSLPGGLLYPFKRFGEGGQLLLQNTSGQRAQVWMNFANTRLDEVQRMIQNGARVDPTFLDAVDESILRALTEIAGTRGDERVELLKQLTQLAIRQQRIVHQLAQKAPPAERARLEQTARLLQGVAEFTQSPDAVSGTDASPLQFLTPSPTPTHSPTVRSTVTPTASATPSPTLTPTTLPAATIHPPTDVPAPTNFAAPPAAPTMTRTAQPSKTPQLIPTQDQDETETPEPGEEDDKSGSGGGDGDEDKSGSGDGDDDDNNGSGGDGGGDDDGDDKDEDDNSGGGGGDGDGDDEDEDDDSGGDGGDDDDDSGGSGGGDDDDDEGDD